MKPEVSVIIPTYNRPHYLSSAIASVYNQTFHNFEIVVVDDASKEDIRSIVNRYTDGRIKYIVHTHNKGEAAARNTGLANSEADYIAFLDDDDEWFPQKLQLQYELLSNSPPTIGAVYTGQLWVEYDTGRILNQIIPDKRGNIYNHMMIDNAVGTPSSVTVRRDCFKTVGLFDERIHYPLDYDMWIRISKHYGFEYIRDPLVKYRVHPNRLSSDVGSVILGWEGLLKKHRQFFLTNKRAFSQHYRTLGHICRDIGMFEKSRDLLFAATRICPYEVRNYTSLLKLLTFSLIGHSRYKMLQNFKLIIRRLNE